MRTLRRAKKRLKKCESLRVSNRIPVMRKPERTKKRSTPVQQRCRISLTICNTLPPCEPPPKWAMKTIVTASARMPSRAGNRVVKSMGEKLRIETAKKMYSVGFWKGRGGAELVQCNPLERMQ